MDFLSFLGWEWGGGDRRGGGGGERSERIFLEGSVDYIIYRDYMANPSSFISYSLATPLLQPFLSRQFETVCFR